MASLIERVFQIVDRHSQPVKPSPKYTIKAQLQRSILFEQMNEKRAKLETFRAQESEFRAVLVAAYGSLAFNAERCKFNMETRNWTDGDSLATPIDHFQTALEAHTNCTEEISYLELDIADDQKDLDDAELWEQVVSA